MTHERTAKWPAEWRHCCGQKTAAINTAHCDEMLAMKIQKTRGGTDRRKIEVKLPAKKSDSRRRPERRHPDISEASFEEFELLMSAKTTSADESNKDIGHGWNKLRTTC